MLCQSRLWIMYLTCSSSFRADQMLSVPSLQIFAKPLVV